MNIYQTNTTPFTYLIGWSVHNKWYYGVRYATQCKPSDLWTTYFTSSNYVKKYKELHGDPDVIQIRKTFQTKEQAIIWEQKVLSKLWKHNQHWLNKNFSGLKFVPTKESILNNKISKKNRTPEYQQLVQQNISNGAIAGHKNRSAETKIIVKEKISAKNKLRDKSVNKKISNSLKDYYSTLSESDKEMIVSKRNQTLAEKRELGIKRKSPTLALCSCIKCKKVFNPGNFTRHITCNN
jgi:hypothetical protein